jgi:Domain of unknown function (DUF4157)
MEGFASRDDADTTREHDMETTGRDEAADEGDVLPVPGREAVEEEQPASELHDGTSRDEDMQSIAAQGLKGPAGPIPHLSAIQRSFGRHDVSGVRAHVAGGAAQASRALGARAFATGTEVGFRETPDLHTAAHEAAHVVQQRAGVHLKNGVGETGDVYERHADEVANLVVAGRSAERLLDEHSPVSGSARPAQPLQFVLAEKVEEDIRGYIRDKDLGIRQEEIDAKISILQKDRKNFTFKKAAEFLREWLEGKEPKTTAQRGRKVPCKPSPSTATSTSTSAGTSSEGGIVKVSEKDPKPKWKSLNIPLGQSSFSSSASSSASSSSSAPSSQMVPRRRTKLNAELFRENDLSGSTIHIRDKEFTTDSTGGKLTKLGVEIEGAKGLTGAWIVHFHGTGEGPGKVWNIRPIKGRESEKLCFTRDHELARRLLSKLAQKNNCS